jgi:exopolysaccharide biosynthesis polyprenyl glycosylphosphotransferase
MVADASLALLVIAAGITLRMGSLSAWPAGDEAPDVRLAIACLVSIWIALLWRQGLYRNRARWTAREEARAVLQATVLLAAIAFSLLYLLKLPDVSRLLLVFVFPALAFMAVAIRIALRLTLTLARRRGWNTRFMIVVGANARAKAFADLVESHTELGLAVIGHLQAGGSDNGVALGRPLLGSVEELEDILHSRTVDEVAICLPFAMESLIEEVARLAEEEGKAVRIPVAPIERVLTLGHLETIDGLGVYSLFSGPNRLVGFVAKRIMDVVASSLLLVLLSPFFALIALAIKLESHGSVFYRQERVGLHGRPFSIVKFRSMCSTADQQLVDLAELNEVKGHAFKLKRDPRVTRVGRVLRRTSLDELPQLLNVLRGEMSLVGPRPPLPDEVARYDVWHRRRLSMKPGMTGLWQVDARHDRDFDRWVEKDLEYIDGWSLWLDLKIMARTVPSMLAGTGQ